MLECSPQRVLLGALAGSWRLWFGRKIGATGEDGCEEAALDGPEPVLSTGSNFLAEVCWESPVGVGVVCLARLDGAD